MAIHDAPPARILLPRESNVSPIGLAQLASDSVGSLQAELARRVGRGLRSVLPRLGAVISFQLDTRYSHVVWPFSLTLSGPDGVLEIEDGPRLLRALTGIDIDPSAEGNSEWLFSAVLGRLADTPFFACDRIARTAPARSYEHETLRLVLRGAWHLVSTRVRSDPATLLTFLSRAGLDPERIPFSACAALPLDIDVPVGSSIVPARSLCRVGAGDVFLPQRTMFDPDGNGQFFIGRVQARVRYEEPGTLIVLDLARGIGDGGPDAPTPDTGSSASRKEREMENRQDEETPPSNAQRGAQAQADNAGGESAEADGLNTLDIPLQFVLGTARMTLGEVRSLGAGSVVLLEGGSPQAIAIESAGKTLGRGEIVDVDGRLGIRVTRWEIGGE